MSALQHVPTRTLLVGTLLGCLSSTPSAQLEFGGVPSPPELLDVEVPTLELPPLNHEELIAEDLDRPKRPFRFGVTQPVQAGLSNAGVWQTMANGDRVWRLRVRSQGAYSLSPIFSSFSLVQGAELFVYDDARNTVRGAYTWLNNKPGGQFAIQPTGGDAITLEYFEPASIRGSGRLSLSGVVHDYRDFLNHGGAPTEGGACNVDVNCAVGNPWRDQIDAVVGVVKGGFVCSAMLINNTANDGRQLLLSANHCGGYNNAVFLFNFQRSGCESGSAPTNQTAQGSTLLAASSSGDFQLVEIIEPISASHNAFYNGWNRGAGAATNTLCVHHPRGCPKKISFDNDPPTRNGSFWRVLDWDIGTTEPGSSGSPLMDQDGRFIGQLCCGLAACGNNQFDDFSALNGYWHRVSSILDPLGTGAVAIDGFDPNGVCPISAQALAVVRNGSGVNPLLFSQRTPAVVGQTWMTEVDLTSFDGAESVLAISLAPLSGISLGGKLVGELLCKGPFLLLEVQAGLHAVPIPLDCSFVGMTLCTQAGVQTKNSLFFTNALDVTIGTF